jgi:hypothetical protein
MCSTIRFPKIVRMQYMNFETSDVLGIKCGKEHVREMCTYSIRVQPHPSLKRVAFRVTMLCINNFFNDPVNVPRYIASNDRIISN